MKSWRVVLGLVLLVLVAPVTGWANCSDYPDPYYEDINGDGIDGDASIAVFVSDAAGNDANPGTMLMPVKTITKGIALAVLNSKKHVYVAGGTYNEFITMADGVSLYGQYAGPPSWGRSGANTTTINASGTAVLAQNLTLETHLEGFTINAGGSFTNYAVRVEGGGGNVYIRYNTILAASGLAGANGFFGGPGAPGGPGLPGVGASCGSSTGFGGPGGPGCFGFSGGTGGSNGGPGMAGIGGAPGGAPGGGPGAPGFSGPPGPNGGGGVGFIVSGGFFAAANGGSGLTGGSGTGGGGGGGGIPLSCGFLCLSSGGGSGGGGGGGGGCGGFPGSGGQGGGGSFGVWVVNGGSAVVDGNNITTGSGGKGGNGGSGGAGGSAGLGAPGGFASDCNSSVGGTGGPGGLGGVGGSGGGAAGGASIGVLASAAGLVRVGSTNTFSIGPGGAPGLGPVGNNGTAGISASLLGAGITMTPSISTVAPGAGSPGTPVTINGSDFDPTPANNEVCFGLGSAAVGSASTSSLGVTVPGGATTGHVKVTVNLLETYSPSPFAFCAAAKGDMNASGDLSGADVVLMLNCAFLGSGNCDLCFADVNCTGDLTAADVVIELNMVFLGAAAPC